MANGVFSGYNKPNFEVKNLTSDMWSPITTNNNFSAYTPPKPTQPQQTSQPSGTRQTPPPKQQRVPAGERQQRPIEKKAKGNGRVQKKQKPVAPKKSPAKPKPQKAKSKSTQADRPISSGNIPQNKPVKTKAPSKLMLNLTAKRNDKTNLEFAKLRNKGKTADEARLIINRRKIRRNRIKTLSSVAVLFVFALTFLLSYSYFEGAEISKIKINGGDQIYTETEILEAAKLETGMNMLTVREKQVNSDVTTVLPFISKIGVDYKLPNVLELNLVSTKEQLILKCARKYICVDSTGKVVSDKKKKLAEGQFLVQGLVEQEYVVGENFTASAENTERFKIALEFASVAEKAETLNYGVLDLKDLDDITFTYRSKIRLYLGDSDNLQKKMESAIGIMRDSDIGDKTGYINLKYDIGAYFMEGSME